MKKKLSALVNSLDLFSLFNAFTRSKVPVFLMHHFCGPDDSGGGPLPPMSADSLDECLGYLKRNDYSVISLSEYVDGLIKGSHSYKSVVFTVDDGYEDFYEYAYPVFKKYNMPATIFLVSDFVEGKIRLWWDVIELAISDTTEGELNIDLNGEKMQYPLGSNDEKSYAINRITEYCKMVPDDKRRSVIESILSALGDPPTEGTPKALDWDRILRMNDNKIEFFPHTKTHPILSRCSEEVIAHEVSESKRIIEMKLGKSANIFSYPNGRNIDFDGRAISELKQSGYVAAFTAEEGYDDASERVDLFRLRRFFFPEDFTRFKRLISGFEAFRMRTRKFV